MTRTVAVIQARTGSNRLPGKVLEPLYGQVSLLAYQCRQLRRIEGVDELVIATTQNPDDDALVTLGLAEGIRVFRGSEHDVLSRFLLTADATQAGTLVRITSDSPFRDPAVITACIAGHRRVHADYTRPAEGHLPKGLRAEVVETAVLKQIDTDPATTARDREHVTVRIRENEASYRTHRVSFPEALHRPHFDLSVDTPADLDRVRALYAALESHGWPADTAHICRLLDDRDGPPSQITDLAS